jgi:predicted dehydrogenase
MLSCKVAIVGAGNMAGQHIRAFSDIDGVDVCGIQSRTREKAEALAARWKIRYVVDSVRELYDVCRPDLVVVAVSVEHVAKVVAECCLYGWTVLAEKPVGVNLAASLLVLETAEAHAAKVFVALNRRFYSSTARVVAELGDLQSRRMVEVLDQQSPGQWTARGGNPHTASWLMFSNSIHLIDCLRVFCRGDVTEIVPFLPWNDSVPMVVGACVRFSSGDTGLYHAVWDAPGPWAVFVTTREKRWELRPLEKAFVQEKDSRILQPLQLDPVDELFKPGLRRQAEEAVKAALGMPSASIPLREAHRTMELIAGIYGM